MKKLLVILVLIGMTLSLTAYSSKNMDKKIYTNYLSIQKALANDNYETAKKAFKSLLLSSKNEFKALAQKGFDSKNLKEMRSNFKDLSLKMVALKAPEGYGSAYCPMAKSWWIQEEGKISNPYYGKKMLRCGSFKEFKKDSKQDMSHH